MTDKESDNDNYDPFSDPVYMALRKSYKGHTPKGPDYKCGKACHHDKNESKDIFLAKWYGLLSSKDLWGGLERLFEHGLLNRGLFGHHLLSYCNPQPLASQLHLL